jgi:hypothetical protein
MWQHHKIEKKTLGPVFFFQFCNAATVMSFPKDISTQLATILYKIVKCVMSKQTDHSMCSVETGQICGRTLPAKKYISIQGVGGGLRISLRSSIQRNLVIYVKSTLLVIPMNLVISRGGILHLLCLRSLSLLRSRCRKPPPSFSL